MAKKDAPLGFDILDRADALFDGVSDLTLLILKAHLLIEEELYNQLRQLFPNPEYYDRLNLRFVQNVMLRTILEVEEFKRTKCHFDRSDLSAISDQIDAGVLTHMTSVNALPGLL